VLIGIGAFIGLFMVISVAIVVFAESQDGEFVTEDVGNSLEKANAVAHYADQRLQAAANSAPLPKPPAILANQRDLRFAMVMTGVSQLFSGVLVLLVTRTSPREFARITGLSNVKLSRIWVIVGFVALAYVGVFIYSLVASAIGISLLEPDSTVPQAVTREDSTLAITGIITLIGAPLTEEMFFRGLIFGGLLRWGFWPAALVSGFLFSGVHFDPGSLLPFMGIGVLLAWVYWRRKSLWDAVTFHFVFNATSFALMLATR
jgi:membrane protease YdiL (CAAX protease family)